MSKTLSIQQAVLEIDEDEDEAELKALDDSAELPPELLLLLSTIEFPIFSDRGRVRTELVDLISEELEVWRIPTETSFGEDDAEREHLIGPVFAPPVDLTTIRDDDDDDEVDVVSSSVDEVEETASLPVDWKWKCL